MIYELDLTTQEAGVVIATLAMANTDAVADEHGWHPDLVREVVIAARTRLENQWR